MSLGRPAAGPGALAEPFRRLGARLLDGLIFSPFTIILTVVVLLIAVPHFGPMFPSPQADGTTSLGGFLWLEVTVIAVGLFAGLVFIVYDAFCTVRWGRTPGKAILHIRAVKLDGRPLGWGAALGRSATTAAAGFLSWIGLVDPLWCLWDDNRQCLHDKAASTIVVQD